jgi:hypothetical protein
VLYKNAAGTFFSILHGSGDMELWNFWEVWTQNFYELQCDTFPTLHFNIFKLKVS